MSLEERKVDEQLDKEIQALLKEKTYTYGGWNKNTLYEMVKLFFLSGEYKISDETRKQVESKESLEKFSDIFSRPDDVINAICEGISNGEFGDFRKICQKMGVHQEEDLDGLIKKLQALYTKEKKEVDEWNDSYEARRYADYENVGYNLCSSSHEFRKSLNVLRSYLEDVSFEIDRHFGDDGETFDYATATIEDVRGLMRKGKLDDALAACEAHDTTKGEWEQLYADLLARLSEKD